MKKNYLNAICKSLFLFMLYPQILNAQFTKLYEFHADNGIRPCNTPLVCQGSVLYGLSFGGPYDAGFIYKVNNDGSGYENIFNFNLLNGTYPSSIIIVNDLLYGTTKKGGNNDKGVIFKINVNGTGFQKLFDLDGSDNGAFPKGSLILIGDSLYGTTSEGGNINDGTIYKINKDGTGFKKIFDFNGSNGKNPNGSMVVIGDSLFGMTTSGGINNNGIIFRIHKNGSGFQDIHDFDNIFGTSPSGSVVVSGDSLYGMTTSSDYVNLGGVFKINKSGKGFQKLLSFDYSNGFRPDNNSLIIVNDSLYGLTTSGGTSLMDGTMFRMHKNGTGFQKLLDFNSASKGATPSTSLLLVGSSLYGITLSGGLTGYGVIFKVNKDGSGYNKLKDCNIAPYGTLPNDLVMYNSYIYGTTQMGGTYGAGVFFKTDTNCTSLQNLHSFERNSGAFPVGSLLPVGDSIYGGAMIDKNGKASIFKINGNGSGYQQLFTFLDMGNTFGLKQIGDSLFGTAAAGGTMPYGDFFRIHKKGFGFNKLFEFNMTNGYSPSGPLILIGDSLFGIASGGGINSKGVIYRINKNGHGYKKIYDFDTNGHTLWDGLTLIGDTLFGTTQLGGVNNFGTIFKIDRYGKTYKKIHDFSLSDGKLPQGILAQIGDFLYGMANEGGNKGFGTLFQINVKTNEFQKLFDFDALNSGSNPISSLYYYNKAFYGTCSKGGADGMGTIFKYKPLASIQASNLKFSNIQPTQMNINFTNGNGNKRLVFIYQGSTGTPPILNGQTYTANTTFGQGSQAGIGWYCVANGDLSGNITITGLTQNTTYRVMVLEYNGVVGAEQYLNWVTTNVANQTTSTVNTSAEKTNVADVQIFPNPTADKLYIKLSSGSGNIQMINLNGQTILIKQLQSKMETLDVSNFTKGIYIIKIITNNYTIVKKIEVR